jgi:imidazolonepropionase
MSDLLVTDIGRLVTNDPSFDGSPLGLISNAAFTVTDGKVSWVGAKSAAKVTEFENVISANGKAVIPGFVDSHNHLIFNYISISMRL